MRRFVAVVLAYTASRVAFALVGFQYSPAGDPFSASKLAIDLGVFVAFFAGFDWLLGRLRTFRSRDDA
jgi:hypothetical protein